jgi:hypothetical protein
LKGRLADLEQSEKQLTALLKERERELEKDRTASKNRLTKLENKMQKKKEKIRQMIFNF